MTENSFGCSEGLINVSAATESVALIVALNLIINAVDRIIFSPCLPMGVIHSSLLTRKVRPKITKNDTNVPTSPYMSIYLIFLKNYFFFKLYPPENIIGGNSAKKNTSSLNSN